MLQLVAGEAKRVLLQRFQQVDEPVGGVFELFHMGGTNDCPVVGCAVLHRRKFRLLFHVAVPKLVSLKRFALSARPVCRTKKA